MLIVVFVLLAAATVPLARGDLRALVNLRFRHTWLLALALATQLYLMFVPGAQTPPRVGAHLGSFVLGIAFLSLNRNVPGLWLIGLGALFNLATIAANGGVMPASPHALAAAGLPVDPGDLYANSAALEHPRLLILGDIFAIPASFPFANVFSLGDLCIGVGAVITLHRTTGSRLMPSGTGQFVQMFRQRAFMRLWSAQIVSNLGDWIYWLAVSIVLSERVAGPQFATALSILLVAQFVPSALVGAFFSGPIVDRHSRKVLMVGADLLRSLAVGSLLLFPEPSPTHFYVVAGFLGLFGAVFQPSLLASIPNVVNRDQIVPAQAMVGATLNIAVMMGPAIGGFLVGVLDPATVVGLNAVSFGVSALLIQSARIAPHDRGASTMAGQGRALAEGVRYIATSRLTRGVIVVIGMVFLAAATKAPVEPLYVRDVLARGADVADRARVLGLITTAWGVGMLLGSVAAPALARRWHRERLFPASIAVVGLAIVAVSQTADFSTVLLMWLLAGTANSIGNVSYESLLQERTPDPLRGRVFAATEAVTDVAFLIGAFTVGFMGRWLPVSTLFASVGGVMLLAAALGVLLVPRPASRTVAPGPRKRRTVTAADLGF
jgi:MFS family permease